MEEKEAHRYKIIVMLFILLVLALAAFFSIRRNNEIKRLVTNEKMGQNDSKKLLQLGADSYAMGDYASAASFFEKAIIQDPQNYPAYLGLGNSYSRLGNYGKAVQIFKETLNLSSHDYRTFYRLGLTYYRMENYENAYANLNIAYGMNRSDDRILSLLITTYDAVGLYDNSISISKQNIEKGANNSQFFRKAAIAYFLKHDLKNASENALKAVQLNPNYAPNHIIFGTISLASGKNQNALNEFKASLALGRSNAAYNGLAAAYSALGEKEISYNHSNLAKSYKPYAFDLSLLGFALLYAKEYNKSIEEFDYAVRINPNYYLPYKGLGIAYTELGQKSKAIENSEKAALLNSLDTESAGFLAELAVQKIVTIP